MMQYDRTNGNQSRSEYVGTGGGIGNFNILLEDELMGKTKNYSKPLGTSYGTNYGNSYNKDTSGNQFITERDK